MFKYGPRNVHDEEQTGWRSVVSDGWSCWKCWPKNLWKTALHNSRTFVWISTDFTHSSLWDCHSLGYHMFCAKWVPKMLTGAHKTQRMASALTF
jgi:hypothetical protein